MADLTDVENVLVNLASQAIYPNGTGSPSVANCDTAIFAGWPVPADLDAQLAANKCFVSVYPLEIETNTTRFPIDWEVISIDTPTITTSITNNQLTISGTISQTVSQTLIVVNNGTAYNYTVQNNDTLNSIASNISGLISESSALNNVITIPGSHKLSCNISVPAVASQEVRRQIKTFQVTVWAPTQSVRTSIASAIDILFSQNYRIVMPDNYYAKLRYVRSHEVDITTKQLCFRRDLFFQVEYATTYHPNFFTVADPFINSVTVETNIT